MERNDERGEAGRAAGGKRLANASLLLRSEIADALIVLRLAADARGRIDGDLLVIERDPEGQRKTGLPAVRRGHRPIAVDRLRLKPTDDLLFGDFYGLAVAPVGAQAVDLEFELASRSLSICRTGMFKRVVQQN